MWDFCHQRMMVLERTIYTFQQLLILCLEAELKSVTEAFKSWTVDGSFSPAFEFKDALMVELG